MKLEINVDFNLEEEVYLKTDPEQDMYLVTSITIDSQGLMYTVSNSTQKYTGYDFEISRNKKY